MMWKPFSSLCIRFLARISRFIEFQLVFTSTGKEKYLIESPWASKESDTGKLKWEEIEKGDGMERDKK